MRSWAKSSRPRACRCSRIAGAPGVLSQVGDPSGASAAATSRRRPPTSVLSPRASRSARHSRGRRRLGERADLDLRAGRLPAARGKPGRGERGAGEGEERSAIERSVHRSFAPGGRRGAGSTRRSSASGSSSRRSGTPSSTRRRGCRPRAHAGRRRPRRRFGSSAMRVVPMRCQPTVPTSKRGRRCRRGRYASDPARRVRARARRARANAGSSTRSRGSGRTAARAPLAERVAFVREHDPARRLRLRLGAHDESTAFDGPPNSAVRRPPIALRRDAGVVVGELRDAVVVVERDHAPEQLLTLHGRGVSANIARSVDEHAAACTRAADHAARAVPTEPSMWSMK